MDEIGMELVRKSIEIEVLQNLKHFRMSAKFESRIDEDYYKFDLTMEFLTTQKEIWIW